MRITASLLTAAMMAVLGSCEPVGLEVKDSSFSIRCEVSRDGGTDGCSLFVTLQSGSREDRYEMDYDIDGDPSLVLLSEDGSPFPSGSETGFTEGKVTEFRMPALMAGSHTVHVVLSNGVYSASDGAAFDTEVPALSIHSEVNTSTDNPYTLLLISVQEGRTDIPYTLSVAVDGEPVAIQEKDRCVDFTKTPICTVTLPTVRPGDHVLTITLEGDGTRNEFSTSFTEPVRFPCLDLTVSHDGASGNHVLTVGRNPYGIRITVRSQLDVTGSCTWWLSGNGWESYPSPGEYRKTTTKSASDSRTVDTTSDGVFVLSERDDIVKSITSQYEMSAIWTEVTDGENCYYKVTGHEPISYTLTSETFAITGSVENVPGVTVRLKGSISGATWNGSAISGSPIPIITDEQ